LFLTLALLRSQVQADQYENVSAFVPIWTWLAGSSTRGNSYTSNYAAQYQFNASNDPTYRWDARFFQSKNNPNVIGMISAAESDLWYADLSTSNSIVWQWVIKHPDSAGSDFSNGDYGVQGVPSASNLPPGRRSAAVAQVDTDAILMYSGEGGSPYWFNDLWHFNMSSGYWTCRQGGRADGYGNGATYSGSYATPGTMTQSSGIGFIASKQLHVFGGKDGSGRNLNELWKYDFPTSTWTWLGGSSTSNYGFYGPMYQASSSFFPEGRCLSASAGDGQRYFFIFGGYAGGSNYNDFWSYDTLLNQWAWLSGGSQPATSWVTPTLPKSALVSKASGNVPGARVSASMWLHGSNSLFLFAGSWAGAAVSNDLWNYNVPLYSWTWIGGTTSQWDQGTYGGYGTASVSNLPTSREACGGMYVPQKNMTLLMGGTFPWAGNSYSDVWTVQMNLSCPPGYYLYDRDSGLCTLCSEATYSDHFHSSSSCWSCPPGTYSTLIGSTTVSECTQCPVDSFNPSPGQSVCSKCPSSTYGTNLGQTVCQNCSRRAITVVKGSSGQESCFCPVDYYGEAFRGVECKECKQVTGISCPFNSSLPNISSGFARNPLDVNDVLTCQPKEACADTSANNATVCSTGYSGSLCQFCNENFYRLGLLCRKCPPAALNVLGFLILVILIIALMRWFSKSQIFKRTEFRTAVFGIQTLALLPSVSSSWPSSISILLGGISLANLNVDLFAPGNVISFLRISLIQTN
jgi:hypothetical protein